MTLTVTFTLPGEVGGGAANKADFGGTQDFLRPVANGDPNESRPFLNITIPLEVIA